jgi:hypothetical protein
MYRKTYPKRRTVTGPRTNQFPAPCQGCGQDVPGGQGELYRDGGQWRVKHRAASWHGSPVSGLYVNGCPADTARLNAAGGWGPESARTFVPPAQVGPDDAQEASRRAGGKYAYTASGARMTLSSARCIDAPCCGCCGCCD